MRFARFGPHGSETPAVFDGTGWRALVDVSMDEVVEDLHDARARVAQQCQEGNLPEIDEGVRIGPPVLPGKVVCIGLNYREHARESGADIPREPVIFLKAGDTVVGPNDPVLIPRGSSKTDWEVELAVVIGRRAAYLASPQATAEVIAGFTISHDVSEREFQLERGGQWDKGKNCETFNPLGPWLVTPDEVPNPQMLGLRLAVNGHTRQSASTSDMIFSVLEIVQYVSQFMVLHPGDVINTGTPAGVALGLPEPKPYLRAGDVVEVDIEGLGRQRQELRNA
ncbi:2-keto-4-pentenoate hydratase/2-oxohepta-3-ene-1,7-dioic acid hydratase in catechol pathway [Microbacterium sp. AK009]|uniref:fumarylacetoacetate hydrolase family protein n=1 Tax=Microbacterium sp. AK009 TaxID=2723068 RepID=UPI0015C8B38B|nr:fumarylacetoacetate hydrolase family protein [Microbacterium sp. AK009]NYF16603.1 2-keto-4-pentenoate hydratase/2-oxohepta-3-ene-1,7-dioic acid hydratase in catechol pathway [Microbacterium sp. AK009]